MHNQTTNFGSGLKPSVTSQILRIQLKKLLDSLPGPHLVSWQCRPFGLHLVVNWEANQRSVE